MAGVVTSSNDNVRNTDSARRMSRQLTLTRLSASRGSVAASSWLGKMASQHSMGSGEEVSIPGPSRLQVFVRSSCFTIGTTLLICINAVFIGIETDYGDGSV